METILSIIVPMTESEPIQRMKTGAGYLADLITASDQFIARRTFISDMPELFPETPQELKDQAKLAAAMVATTPRDEQAELKQAYTLFVNTSTTQRSRRVLANLKFAQWGIKLVREETHTANKIEKKKPGENRKKRV